MECCNEVLKPLVGSKLRVNILRSLESPMRLSDLRRVVNANAPNTSAKAKDLITMGLIERDNGTYQITDTGEIVNKRLNVFIDTLDTLYEYHEFWEQMLNHMPQNIIDSLHLFKGAEFIKNEKVDLERVTKKIIQFIEDSTGNLVIVLPVKSKEITKAIKEAEKRVQIKLMTLDDDPKLSYGIVSSGNKTILFSELLDMALVKESLSQNNKSEVCGLNSYMA